MTGLSVVLLLSLLLILINALFVAAEFALIGSPKASLEGRASRGDRFAARILRTLTSPKRQDEYLAASQLGITLASLGLGMYGEHRLAELFEHWVGGVGSLASAGVVASVLALALLTIGHIVLGEMMPKTIALQHPIAVARFTDWPVRLTAIVLYPIVRIAYAIARATLRLIGIRRRENVHEQIYTPEELQLIVEESERGGALAPRLEPNRARALRVRRPDRGAGDGAARPRRRHSRRRDGRRSPARWSCGQRRTRYAVYEGDLDHIVGMVHVKDLLRLLTQGGALRADDARRMPVVPETASLDDVLATMQRGHAHMAVVIDEHGGTAGIVGLEDIFEEVVGEIDDGVPATPSLVAQDDGLVRAAGTVRLDELGQHFNVDLEHEEVDSVSGLVLARLGRPPVKGDRVDYGRLRLEVTATSGRGVREVRASLLPEEA